MAGEVRDWIPGLPVIDRRDYTDSPYLSTCFKAQVLEYKVTPFCAMEVSYNPLFGHMLFIDGEIQISDVDYEDYHVAMWKASRQFISVPDLAPRVLVIGDGDGGFTRVRTGAKSIDVVERDGDVIRAGAQYFGADWNRVALHQKCLEEFKPAHEYDIVMLAIDDGFNTAGEFEADLDRIASWLKPGGKIVAQAGADLDPKHPRILARYRDWADSKLFPWASTKVFVRCFFCHENFFVVQRR